MRLLNTLSISGVLVLSACASTPAHHTSVTFPALEKAPFCESAAAALSIEHSTANISACDVRSDRRFELTIRPENTPINDSAWYGFRVDPKTSGTLNITLKYKDGEHRYNPKLSYDGQSWTVLPKSKTNAVGDDVLTMRLKMDDRSFYVSAQEILTKETHDSWSAKMAAQPFVNSSIIGKSMDGHPIQMLEAKSGAAKKPYVMFVGRQHPPEITGALALIPFVEKVLGDDELAKDFRDKFNILIVPNMNPDGVTAGHWRHNKGGVDLNRDWGPFTQPETQAVKRVLKPFEDGSERIVLFLDFHSTKRNLLYTHTDAEATQPPMFSKDWLEAVDARLDDKVYSFTREANKKSEQKNSKNYMYGEFGIPAITYEVGDETDRKSIEISAKVFAEEMMRLLLEHENK